MSLQKRPLRFALDTPYTITELFQKSSQNHHVTSKTMFILNTNGSYNLVSRLHNGATIGQDEGKENPNYTLLGSQHLIDSGLPGHPNLKPVDEVIIGGHQWQLYYPI